MNKGFSINATKVMSTLKISIFLRIPLILVLLKIKCVTSVIFTYIPHTFNSSENEGKVFPGMFHI